MFIRKLRSIVLLAGEACLLLAAVIAGGFTRVCALDDIPAIVRHDGAERIVVSLSNARGHLPMERLLDIRLQTNVAFDELSSAYEAYTGKVAVETLRPSAFVFSSGFRKTRRLLTVKRALDVVLALAVLVVTAPVVALAVSLVKLM